MPTADLPAASGIQLSHGPDGRLAGVTPLTMARDYVAYGLRLRSELPLPLTPLDGRFAEQDVDLRLSRGSGPAPEPQGELVAVEPCPVHEVDGRIYRGPSGTWIWNRDVGVCVVAPDARSAVIYPEAGVDEQRVGLALAGILCVFVLHQRGCPTLHASAVLTPAGVVAFVGTNGQGKSSMAAAFLRRGATLVTDDVLPLQAAPRGILAAPSVPHMKLWPASAEGALAITEELPSVFEDHDKRLLQLDGRYPFLRAAAPLAAMYVLFRYDGEAAGRTDVTIQPLTLQQGLAVVLAQVSRGAYLLPSESARFLPTYSRLVKQAPVRTLAYPNGFQHQEAVYQAILADLQAGARA